MTGARCQATKCTLCHSFIGANAHSARGCCNRSNQVFPDGNVSAGKSKSAGARGGGKSSGNSEGHELCWEGEIFSLWSWNGVPSSTTVSTVPEELQQMRALLA